MPWKWAYFVTKNALKNGSTMRFPKSDRAPIGMLNPVLLARFEPMVMTGFGPWKIPKCASLGTTNGSRMGQKHIFPKLIVDHLGCTNKAKDPMLCPLSHFGVCNIPKALKMGHLVTKKASHMGQNVVFQ